MHDSSHFSVCRLHQTIPVGDRCIQGWIGGGVVTEAGRWAVPPHCLWQQSPKTHEKNYHSTKLEFLALKWVVTEHFKEYLPYQSFVAWMDNNLLMYKMSTHNLDAMGHQWVGPLTQFNFKLEYQKGCDNTMTGVLS